MAAPRAGPCLQAWVLEEEGPSVPLACDAMTPSLPLPQSAVGQTIFCAKKGLTGEGEFVLRVCCSLLDAWNRQA